METTSNWLDLKSMVLMALFAAITCVLAPMSVPIGPVPISLGTLVIYFSVVILGWQRSLISTGVYVLLGLVGLPVFTGFEGGIGKIAGPTGGYLLGYFFMIIVCGLFIEIKSERTWMKYLLSFAGMVLGTAVLYAFGTVWFCISTGSGVWAALLICVFPFVLGDLVKIILAVVIAPKLAEQIKKIG